MNLVSRGWCVLVIAATACGSGDVIEIHRGNALLVSFDVEVAQTAVERERGLRGHAPLASGFGLLIRFPRSTEACIENAGVNFPIDVIYADEAGMVVAIEREVAANDYRLRCYLGVRSVLEVGEHAALAVRLGDLLDLSRVRTIPID